MRILALLVVASCTEPPVSASFGLTLSLLPRGVTEVRVDGSSIPVLYEDVFPRAELATEFSDFTALASSPTLLVEIDVAGAAPIEGSVAPGACAEVAHLVLDEKPIEREHQYFNADEDFGPGDTAQLCCHTADLHTCGGP